MAAVGNSPNLGDVGSAGGSPLSDAAATGMLPFVNAFVEASSQDPRALWTSFTMIIFSEIGDKTFLIAAILAMRHSRLIVFAGAFGSLVVMSILSAALGAAFPSLMPKSLTTLMASVLFFVFGARMWTEGQKMSGGEIGEEWEEAKREIEEGEEHEMAERDQGLEEGRGATSGYPRIDIYPAVPNTDSASGGETASQQQPMLNGNSDDNPKPNQHSHSHSHSDSHSHHGRGSDSLVNNIKEGTRNLCGLCFSPVFAQAFVLTFLGEWGDRSQIATIALAAAHNVTLVSLGTIIGHSLCTALAVLGGSWLASRISAKHITLGGAVLFLLFGLIYLFESYEEWSSSPLASTSSGHAGIAMTTNAAKPSPGALAAAAKAKALAEAIPWDR